MTIDYCKIPCGTAAASSKHDYPTYYIRAIEPSVAILTNDIDCYNYSDEHPEGVSIIQPNTTNNINGAKELGINTIKVDKRTNLLKEIEKCM